MSIYSWNKTHKTIVKTNKGKFFFLINSFSFWKSVYKRLFNRIEKNNFNFISAETELNPASDKKNTLKIQKGERLKLKKAG